MLSSPLHLSVRAIAARAERLCRVIDYSDGGLLIEWLRAGGQARYVLQRGDRVDITTAPTAPGLHPDRSALRVAASVARIAFAIVALQFERADPRALERLRGCVMLHVDEEP